jgi:hypothetical protein
MKYLIVTFSVVILILGLYCKSLKSDLEVSEQNNKILENSLKVQDETISKLKDDYSKIQSANSELNELYNSQMKRFQIHDAINSFENNLKSKTVSAVSNEVSKSSKECLVPEHKTKVQYSIYKCYKDSKCDILQ